MYASVLSHVFLFAYSTGGLSGQTRVGEDHKFIHDIQCAIQSEVVATITERYYAAWTEARQRQVEADLKRAWEDDPLVLFEGKVTRKLRGKTNAVN